MAAITIVKALNNNVVMAEHPDEGEVIVIGKGIGFNRKEGDSLSAAQAEKLFVLKNEKEQEQYKKLLPQIDEAWQSAIIEAIGHISERVSGKLNEHIHIGLTDHLLLAMERVRSGHTIVNPFLTETVTLYPFEQGLAKDAVEIIGEKTGIYLPKDEIGFITLHIHSALMNKELGEVNRHSQLVTKLIHFIESDFELELDKESLDYMRLVRHLRFTIERVVQGEKVQEPEKIAQLLKYEYPLCYNLAWKLIKVMQEFLKKKVYDAEAVYLTMHLQRLKKYE
ncbi:glucose PTS transporter transcription antiterminator GlcT [Oceanobacillus alkalisoli]|uniref:glucose PTS transporter transcription antiterminator GlcT n=1 Tax=Oceanobacillus alkalisoli TaxID=2925113 RepID=UPI0021044DC7|nr:PRD domain-containing protein [Oceanobacillus alkalisoli]